MTIQGVVVYRSRSFKPSAHHDIQIIFAVGVAISMYVKIRNYMEKTHSKTVLSVTSFILVKQCLSLEFWQLLLPDQAFEVKNLVWYSKKLNEKNVKKNLQTIVQSEHQYSAELTHSTQIVIQMTLLTHLRLSETRSMKTKCLACQRKVLMSRNGTCRGAITRKRKTR